MNNENWYIELHNLTIQVSENSTIKDTASDQVNDFKDHMSNFLTQVKLFQMHSEQEQKKPENIVVFSTIYQKLLNGLTRLLLACPDPDESIGRFDYGKQQKEHTEQIESLTKLYEFVEECYVDLVTANPALPISYNGYPKIKLTDSNG